MPKHTELGVLKSEHYQKSEISEYSDSRIFNAVTIISKGDTLSMEEEIHFLLFSHFFDTNLTYNLS